MKHSPQHFGYSQTQTTWSSLSSDHTMPTPALVKHMRRKLRGGDDEVLLLLHPDSPSNGSREPNFSKGPKEAPEYRP